MKVCFYEPKGKAFFVNVHFNGIVNNLKTISKMSTFPFPRKISADASACNVLPKKISRQYCFCKDWAVYFQNAVESIFWQTKFSQSMRLVVVSRFRIRTPGLNYSEWWPRYLGKLHLSLSTRCQTQRVFLISRSFSCNKAGDTLLLTWKHVEKSAIQQRKLG